ncbi:MAG: tetratricopeptide repeat protein [Actinomadura sp.]
MPSAPPARPCSELWATRFVVLAYCRQGRTAEAERCLDRAVELFALWGGRFDTENTGKDLAGFALAHGRLHEAEVLAHESVADARADGDLWSTGRALMTLGEIAQAKGDHQAALDAYLEAVLMWRTLKARTKTMRTLRTLSELCDDLGDAQRAAACRAEYALLLAQPV